MLLIQYKKQNEHRSRILFVLLSRKRSQLILSKFSTFDASCDNENNVQIKSRNL